jgi:hypothetical protein
MVTLYDARSGAALGTLSDEQLAELSARLEEEWAGDQDYYIDTDTVDMLEAAGLSPAILELLRRAIAETGEADVRWSAGR